MAAQNETTRGMFLEEAAIQEFKTTLRGELLRPGEDSYDDARKVFNISYSKLLHKLLAKIL